MLKERLLIFYLAMFLFFLCSPIQAKSNSSLEVVRQYIDCLNHQNWRDIPDLWVQEEKESLLAFLKDKTNETHRRGLFNIKSAELMMWKRLPYTYAENYLPSRYMEKFKDREVLYVGVKYGVYREDQYHINGVNYFLIAIASENGKRKIILTPHVPVTSLISDGYGFGTSDEKTFDERRLKFVN